jgi:hypothetical protein
MPVPASVPHRCERDAVKAASKWDHYGRLKMGPQISLKRQ